MTGQEGTRIAKLRLKTTTPQVQMATLFSKTKLFWLLQGQVPEIVLDRQFINHAWHAGPTQPSMYASTSPTGVVLAMQVGPPVGAPVTGAIPCLREPDSLKALQQFTTRNILQNITTSINIVDEPAALRVNTIQGGVWEVATAKQNCSI
jgi:hypothetical protein